MSRAQSDIAAGDSDAPTPRTYALVKSLALQPLDYQLIALIGFAHILEREIQCTSSGAAAIAAERAAHISREGWTPEHDDEHNEGELAYAAACYAFTAAEQVRGDATPFDQRAPLIYWPWDSKWWKPKDQRRNLVRAGALIAAEIDRLDRASSSKAPLQEGKR
jgi:hypothetical protein